MRNVSILVILLLTLSSNVSWGGGSVAGTLAMEPGTPGDLFNTRVSIYASYGDWSGSRPLTFVAASGSGPHATYAINNIPPGQYYLDAWLDVDSDGWFDAGDYYGVYGNFEWPVVIPTPILIMDGQTTVANVLMHFLGEPVPIQPMSWGRIKAAYR